jgi:hypothetical protein
MKNVSSALDRRRGLPVLYVLVMLGSALGGGARYWCSGFVASHFGETFPWGTLIVGHLDRGAP